MLQKLNSKNKCKNIIIEAVRIQLYTPFEKKKEERKSIFQFHVPHMSRSVAVTMAQTP